MKRFHLVSTARGLGIYEPGGGYIVNPHDTLLFNHEIILIFMRIEKEYSALDREIARGAF